MELQQFLVMRFWQVHYSGRGEQLGNLLQLIQTANEGSVGGNRQEKASSCVGFIFFISLLILPRSPTSAKVSFSALPVLTTAEAAKGARIPCFGARSCWEGVIPPRMESGGWN